MKNTKWILAAAAAAVLAGCASVAPPPVLKDGELPSPADYKSWPRFLPTIDRADVKQIRDIYINPVGAKINKGEAFPQGSRFVMEIHAAATEANGDLKRDAAGRLVKGNLLHVYVMGKEANWGTEGVAEALRTGNWIYAAYKPDGSVNAPLSNTCRGCHVPMAKDDFVIHLDRYFAERKAGFSVEQIHAQAATSAQIADAQAVASLAKAAR